MDEQTAARLASARNIWIATVRPDGRPHLTPVWFVVAGDTVLICISARSVKAANLRANDRCTCALEDGNSPTIFEGLASFVDPPWPETAVSAFKEKYDWDLRSETDYDLLVELKPEKWLTWN